MFLIERAIMLYINTPKMAVAPKKKYDFYNHGVGIRNDDTTDNSLSPQYSTTYDDTRSVSESSTRQSSPFQPDEKIQSPCSISSGYCSAVHDYEIQSVSDFHPYNEHAYLPSPHPPIELHAGFHSLTHRGFSSVMSQPAGTSYQHRLPSYPRAPSPEVLAVGSSSPPRYESNPDEGRTKLKAKRTRPQRCRMCFNHNAEVQVKGHKWFCPYRDCHCPECDITRKTQFYMKERQKLTRKQQQRDEENLFGKRPPSEENLDIHKKRRTETIGDPMDFPRTDELKRETQNIIDNDLFEKINQACRPRSNFRR